MRRTMQPIVSLCSIAVICGVAWWATISSRVECDRGSEGSVSCSATRNRPGLNHRTTFRNVVHATVWSHNATDAMGMRFLQYGVAVQDVLGALHRLDGSAAKAAATGRAQRIEAFASSRSGSSELLLSSHSTGPWPLLVGFAAIVGGLTVGRRHRSRGALRSLATPVDVASLADSVEANRAITQPEVQSDRKGRTALMAALAAHPEPARVATLLRAGADVHVRSERGETALTIACRNGACPLESVRLLVAAGADVNANSDPFPLSLAARHHPSTVVEALLAAGAHVNDAGESGWTALHDCGYTDEATVLTLLAAGANVRARTSIARTPLMELAGRVGNAGLIHALIDAGSDVNAVDQNGWTPLHFAALLNRNPGVLRVLIGRGANINAQSSDGASPLIAAAFLNTSQVVAWLLALGADTTLRDEHGRQAIDHGRLDLWASSVGTALIHETNRQARLAATRSTAVAQIGEPDASAVQGCSAL